MNESTLPRVTSFSKRSGPLKRVNNKEPNSHLRECDKKWNRSLSLKEQTVKWRDLPVDMVADYARAMCHDFEEGYGSDASSKATQMLSNIAVIKELDKLHLHNECHSLKVSFDLTVNVVPEDTNDEILDENETVRFELDVPEGTDDAGAKKALRDWADSPDDNKRASFDPVNSLPDENLAAIIIMVEKSIPTGNDLDILLCATGFIMFWKQMEKYGASDSTIAFSGLTDKDEYICPDMKVILKASAIISEKSNKNVMNEKKKSVAISVFK